MISRIAISINTARHYALVIHKVLSTRKYFPAVLSCVAAPRCYIDVHIDVTRHYWKSGAYAAHGSIIHAPITVPLGTCRRNDDVIDHVVHTAVSSVR